MSIKILLHSNVVVNSEGFPIQDKNILGNLDVKIAALVVETFNQLRVLNIYNNGWISSFFSFSCFW